MSKQQDQEEKKANMFSTIREYETDFNIKKVTIVPGYNFSQIDTIKKINLYYASKYESGNEDELGYKFFFNIGKPKVKNAGKNIDVGTKDVLFKAIDGRDRRRAWVMRRDGREWMREQKLGKIFNKMAMSCPKFGSIVAKRVQGDKIFSLVDLRLLKNDPTAENLNDSWVIESHYYTPRELRRMAGPWDSKNIELAINSFTKHKKENYVDSERTDNDNTMGKAKYIHVREFYDDVPESWVKKNGKPDKYVQGQIICILPEPGLGGNEQNKSEKDQEGLILYTNPVGKKEDLYKECHYDREDGRWLGIGEIENNFETQLLKNENINQIVLANQLASLIILATDDKKFARNILTSTINGDVLRLSGQLQRIPTEVRNAGVHNLLSEEIERLSNTLSNSFESTTGESMPSGTPLGLGVMMNQQAMKLFNFVRENFGLFLEEIFNDWVVPKLEKDLSAEHILEITSQEEMEWLFNEYKKDDLWEMIKKTLKDGKWPTQGEMEVVKQVLQSRQESKESLYLKLPKSFYKGFRKSTEVRIVNESFDMQEQIANLATILQMSGGNAQILNHPAFQKMLDLKGYSEIDVAPRAEPVMSMGSPGAGAPVVAPAPSPAERVPV